MTSKHNRLFFFEGGDVKKVPGLLSCIARSTLKVFLRVVGARNSNPSVSTQFVPDKIIDDG